MRAEPGVLYLRRARVVHARVSAFLIDLIVPLPALGAQALLWPLHHGVIASVAAWPLRRQRRRLGLERVETKVREVAVNGLVAILAVSVSVSGVTKEGTLRAMRPS